MGHTIKEYPQIARDKLNKVLEETSELRKKVDDIDKAFLTGEICSDEQLKKYSRIAAGAGNGLRRQASRLEAAVKNEKYARKVEIQTECNDLNTKYVDSAATPDAEAYVRYLRLARDVLLAYVTNADNIVSVCRMHLSSYKQDHISEVEV